MIKLSFLIDRGFVDSFEVFLSGYRSFFSDYRIINTDSKLSFVEFVIYDSKPELYKKIFDWLHFKLSRGELV